MPSNTLRCAALLVAVLVGTAACAEDRRPSDFSFKTDERDAGQEVGPDVGFDGPTATLQLFHNAPDQSLSAVDVYASVQGQEILVADDLEFRNYTPYLAVPADTPWDVLFAGAESNDDGALQSDEVLNTVEGVELSADTRNLAIAHGSPVDLTMRTGVLTSPAQDAVNALLFNGSPGLPAIDMSPSNAYEEFVFYDDVEYGAFSEEYEQFSQPDVFEIRTGNGIFITNLQPPLGVEPTFGGGVLTAATSGQLVGGRDGGLGFRLAVFSNNLSVVGTRSLADLPARTGEPSTLLQAGARVRFVHAASAEGFETVDLEIGEEPENVSNLNFSEASDFYSLPAGTGISVDITGAEASLQRSFSVDLPNSGLPVTKTVFITGNGQNQQVQLRSVDTRETARFGNSTQDPQNVGFHLFHAWTTESFSTVDVSFLNTSGDVLRGPVTLDYGNAFSGSVGPVTDLATLRVSLGGSNFDFSLSPIDEGTYATIYLADAPTALGISAYALVGAQDPVELPRE